MALVQAEHSQIYQRQYLSRARVNAMIGGDFKMKYFMCEDCGVEMIERTHDKTGNVFYCPECSATKVENYEE